MAHRVSRFLERQGLLVRDDETTYLSLDTEGDDPMESLIGHSVTYRIATGPRQGRKVLTLQTLPAIDEPFTTQVGNVAGFSLHAGVAPNSQHRALVTKAGRGKERKTTTTHATQDQTPAERHDMGAPTVGPLRGRLKRVFGIDIELTTTKIRDLNNTAGSRGAMTAGSTCASLFLLRRFRGYCCLLYTDTAASRRADRHPGDTGD